jgi:cellobiose transport system permease protein
MTQSVVEESKNAAQHVASATAPPPLSRSKAAYLGRSPQDTPASPWNYVFLVVAILASAFPIYWMFVISSGTDQTLAHVPPDVIPKSFANLQQNVQVVLGLKSDTISGRTFTAADFTNAFVNSVLVTAIVTAGMLFFCSLAGFAFAKLRFKGRDPLMVIVLLTLTIPNQLGVVALYIVMVRLGWQEQLIAVVVPALVSAFGVFYMRQFIQDSVPDELIESARVDGASTFRVYWNLVLPIIRPALGVLGLLTAVGTWNEFQWALIVLGSGPHPTIGVALSRLASGNYVKYRIVIAGSLLATLPLIILLFVAGRQIVKGIMEGALKA